MREQLPMLAISSTGASGRQPIDVRQLVETGDWVLDTKLDGVRAWLMPDGKILNRKGVDVTYKFPEIHNLTGEWLDGEIIALDGTFESTLVRESQENRALIRRTAMDHPCKFVAFDLPGHYTREWDERRYELTQLAEEVATTVVSYDVDFIDHAEELGLEGVIAKRITARYQFGKRSADWVKHKFVRRVTCIAYGYSPGHGSRAHFGALHLALIGDDGNVVSVGRTGSGFTERQTHELKARLDAEEHLVVEVEYLNVTSGGQLRHPVYRGIRTDVAITECLHNQLERS